MKNLKITFAITFLLIISSCSKSDDNSVATGNIVGKWSIDRAGAIENGQEVDVGPFELNKPDCLKDYKDFMTDGNYKLVSHDVNCIESAATGTWTKEGNIIKISDGQFATYEIVSLTETAMKVKFKNPSIKNEYTDTFYLVKN